jgi:hypothetical protein
VLQVRISRSRSSNAAIQFNEPPVTETSPEGVFNVPNRRVTDLDREVPVEWIDDDVDRGYVRPDFGGALRWCLLLGLAGIDLLPVRQMVLEERHADQNLQGRVSARQLACECKRCAVWSLPPSGNQEEHVTGSAKREAATPITARPRKHPQGRVRYGLISHQSKEGHGIGSLNK